MVHPATLRKTIHDSECHQDAVPRLPGRGHLRKQGWIFSPFLFSVCINWVIENAAKDQRSIRWALRDVLSDLDLADNI